MLRERARTIRINGAMMSAEDAKLKLDRQRLAVETMLKRRDQQFQRYQFEVTRRGPAGWALVATPIGAAVIAGIVALFGTVWNAYQANRLEDARQKASFQLERQRLEGSLILDAIKTVGIGAEREKQAAANLLFLAEMGLITLPPSKVQPLRDAAANALPSLPVEPISQGTPGPAPSFDWSKRLRESEDLRRDGKYPESLRMAQQIINHPDVPPDVASRAREIAAAARADLRRAFESAGETKETVRKRR